MATDAALDVAAEPALAPLTAMRRLEFAEHLRLPYVVSQLPRTCRRRIGLAAAGRHGTRSLELWPMEAQLPLRPVMARLRLIDQPAIALCARILDDCGVQARLGEGAGDWSRVAALTGVDGQPVGSLWTDRDGNLLLPFDPDEVLLNYWSERYVDELESNGRGWGARAALRTYYRVRVVLPRAVQIWMRRRYARVQARTPFPRWPLETSLHDYIDLLLGLLADLAGAELPYIAPWPDGHSWALVLTHDVETTVGLGALDPLLDIERSHGMRSSWNFVPRRYAVPDALVRELQADGFEVGVHGLHHDGRDLSSLSGLRSRLPAIHAVAQRWRAVGFRSPASHRRWEWMALLPFDYDSSYPDTDPFEPQRGGCCSWWPFFNGQLVELPLTMPHDHTLFVILGHRDESTWVDKAQVLRERGGMALIVTHPDYLLEGPGLAAYDQLLARYAADDTAWQPLPAQVSAWWRQRAASSIVPSGSGWAVTGPAAAPSPDRVRSGWARVVSLTPTRSPTPRGASRDLEVAVIGAGPHGLAAGVALRRAGVAAHVFGEPMSFWRSMPAGMRLRSNLLASNMIELEGPFSLAAYRAVTPHAGGPDRVEFVAYGSWVQAQAIPDLDRRLVTSVQRDGGGWRLALADGETVSAARVVVAAGIGPFEHRPDGFAHLGDERVTHSAAHRDPARLRGRRVTIVGGGQSACELAALLVEAGAAEVEVLVRAPSVVWLRGHSVKRRIGRLGPIVYAPTDVGPLWYSRLVERPGLFARLPRSAQDRGRRALDPAGVRRISSVCGSAGVRLTLGVEVIDAQADGGRRGALTLSDRTHRAHRPRDPGHWISGRCGVVIRFSATTCAARCRWPTGSRCSPGLESSVPGLHFTGAPAAWSFGPIMRFVSGAGTGAGAGESLGRRAPSRAVERPGTPGAVVIGGDYQGLAIARSLGRRGIPVFVLDDERSIAPDSRYVQRSERVASLRHEEATVDGSAGARASPIRCQAGSYIRLGMKPSRRSPAIASG